MSEWSLDVVANPTIGASPSYADHAERIQKLLEAEEVIPATDVRLVSIKYAGRCFYIHNEDYQVLIPIGRVKPDGSVVPEDSTRKMLDNYEIPSKDA